MSIQETTFGPKRYLVIKKSIAISQISDTDMYDTAGKQLGAYMAVHAIPVFGPWSVLYFTWDEANQTTDIAIGFPVDGLTEVEDTTFSIVDIPETKAAMDVLVGSYDGLGAVHGGLMTYTREKGYTSATAVIAVEEYEVGPMSGQTVDHWKTNIYYLHA